MAPEIICQKHYDAKADLWSVGVILYGMFLNKLLLSTKIVNPRGTLLQWKYDDSLKIKWYKIPNKIIAPLGLRKEICKYIQLKTPSFPLHPMLLVYCAVIFPVSKLCFLFFLQNACLVKHHGHPILLQN